MTVECDQCVHIVDDDEALRDSLAWMLGTAGYRVRAYASAQAFLATGHEGMTGCVLLDVRMPAMSGLELFDALRRQCFALPVIFVTGHGDVPMAVAALKKGAFDFIEKPFGERDIVRVIERALLHERAGRAQRDAALEGRRRMESLTQREREVLDLVVVGRLNKQIGDELGISIKTVEVHRARVMEKMAATSLAELVSLVLQLKAPPA